MATTIPAPAEGQQKLPFRNGVRHSVAQLVQPAPSTSFSAGQPWSFTLNRVGAVNHILLEYTGTIDTAAGFVADYRFPYNILGDMTLAATVGATALVEIDGWGTRLIQPTVRDGYDLTADTRIYNRPTAVGAGQAVRVVWLIPIAMNQGEQFEIGALLLQTRDVEVTLSGRWAMLSDLGVNVSAMTGTLRASMVYFEMGNPAIYNMPRLSLVRWRTDRVQINGTGEVRIPLRRFGTIHNIVTEMIINGVPVDAWDRCTVQFNRVSSPYTFTPASLRAMERRWMPRYVAPVGVNYFDFYNAYEEVNRGDLRDALDPEELSEMEIVFNLPQSVVLGANNNYVLARTRSSQLLGR